MLEVRALSVIDGKDDDQSASKWWSDDDQNIKIQSSKIGYLFISTSTINQLNHLPIICPKAESCIFSLNMGTCGSSHFIPSSIIGQSKGVLITAFELGYSSEDVDVMYTAFSRLDIDKSGIISIDEFIIVYKITNVKLMVLQMSIFDQDKSGGT